MFELIVVGPEPRQRLKYRIAAGESYILGRGIEADLVVPWDAHISRRHVRLSPDRTDVNVEKLPSVSNPLCYQGANVDACSLVAGEHFVLGSTTIHVASAQSIVELSTTHPVEEVAFDPRELRKVKIRDADRRIDVLANLSEVIWGARSDAELHHRLVNLLLAGITHADAAAIVQLDENNSARVLHWDRRREIKGKLQLSDRLVVDALSSRRRSVLHVWETQTGIQQDYTAVGGFDWAFCTPVLDSSRDTWGIYVAGALDVPVIDEKRSASESIQLQADVKFTEIIAEIMSSVQRSNRSERKLASLRQFLPPTVLSAMGEEFDIDMLEPRECDVTVLFCDLRGFSKRAEEAADDLLGLLDRVSTALGVMTNKILKYGGVTGDFQGDAALGFWGWPLASDEAPLNACRAALEIRQAFAETRDQKDHPLANFEMGIGIAHGRAVAGKIGTSDQIKLTAFGPVVNLASRLEGLTKQLRVPILLDEATAEFVAQKLVPDEARLRRLAKLQPFGMEISLVVSELLPPASASSQLTDEQLIEYERGVDHFIAGRWEEAYDCLHRMPAGDRAQDFLALEITRHNRVAPPDWNGVVRMPSK